MVFPCAAITTARTRRRLAASHRSSYRSKCSFVLRSASITTRRIHTAIDTPARVAASATAAHVAGANATVPLTSRSSSGRRGRPRAGVIRAPPRPGGRRSPPSTRRRLPLADPWSGLQAQGAESPRHRGSGPCALPMEGAPGLTDGHAACGGIVGGPGALIPHHSGIERSVSVGGGVPDAHGDRTVPPPPNFRHPEIAHCRHTETVPGCRRLRRGGCGASPHPHRATPATAGRLSPAGGV